MNIALILAGGNGQRMNQDIPKQFINVFDKPIIIYTLEAFQKHPDIHEIAVVCLEGWHDILKAYAKQFGITKLKWIIDNGTNGQESIKNGVFFLKKHCSDNDIVIVHDGIRPLVSSEIISDCLAKCSLYGNATVTIPCNEAMLRKNDNTKANETIPRSELVRTQTPQAFKLSKLLWLHEEACKKNIVNSIASCSLMIELGETVYFSIGSEKNIKLTTPDDIEIFKALLKTQKEDWLK